MVKSFLTVLLFSVCCGSASGQVQTFRTELAAGDDSRDWNCIWTRGGLAATDFGFFKSGDDITQQVQLMGPDGIRRKTVELCFREADWFEGCFYRTFRLPVNCPTGDHRMMIGAKDCGPIKVTKTLQATTYLVPGIRRDGLTMQPNTRYIADGCTIRGPIKLAPGASLISATIVDGLTHHDATGMVFRDCKFIRGQVGGLTEDAGRGKYIAYGVLFDQCSFDCCQVTGVCSGCFLNCTWTGRVTGSGWGRNGHNFANETASRLCMFNCTFDRTDRGPVTRTGAGDSSNNLYIGLQLLNINSTTNGNELVCIEGGRNRYDRNVFLGLRAFNCVGDWQLWNSAGSGNLIGTSHFGKGSGVHFSGLEPQVGNEVRLSVLSKPLRINGVGVKAEDTRDLENQIKP